MIPRSFDILGNIIIVKFNDSVKKGAKVKVAKQLLKKHKSVETILEKSDKVRGRLRTIKTVHLAGKKGKVALYRENNCLFKFDVEKTYFSPRLSNERKEIAGKVRKKDKVLVMFAGVAPFSVVIAKIAKPEIVYSVEINRKASKYAEENKKLNKLNNLEIVQGDVKRIVPGFVKKKIKFDKVVMPRPQLKDSFLESAFKVVKKGGEIYYYGFGKDHEEILKEIKGEASKARKKVRILKVKKAGDIAPYKFRWRVDLRVMN